MSPNEIAQTLTALLPTGRPVYLWGPPGTGKSSVIRQAAEDLNLSLVDVRATLLDPVDLRGLPRVDGDQVKWSPPVFLPRDGQGVLFLDELAQAPPLVQSACLQLTLDRKLGEYELPDGWTVVAASNRSEDRAGTHRLISPLLNRFIHLDMEVDPDGWQTWAVQKGIAPEVRAFLRFKPQLLNNFDPSTNPRAFATPRSWQFVSDVLDKTPSHLVHRVAAGCVGDGPAAEFHGFLRVYQQLPDIDLILANPKGAHVPTEPDVLCSVVGALVEKVRKDKTRVNSFVGYVTRLQDEYSMLGIRDLLAAFTRKVNGKTAIDPAVSANPLVAEWVKQAQAKGLFIGV